MTVVDDQQMGRLRAAAAEPGPGDVVDGRFELVEVIGEGGMGLVWSALDREQGRQIALKIVTTEGADTDGRLQREADAMSRLSHPAIVRTLAVGAAGSVRYVAMELLEGCTLADRLGRGPLPIGEAVEIGQRVAGALACMHEAGLIHRDIKPTNVFLVDGSTATAKLLDFGLVRAVEGDKVTKTGAIVGTPGHMAPEQVRGERTVGPAADVFCLGCLLFECVSGRPAFEGASEQEVFSRILLEQPPALDELREGIPQRFHQLVAGMLDKSASNRPDANEILRVLDSLTPTDSSIEESSPLPFGLRPGMVLADRYRVERLVAEGGMGIVLAAHHLQLGTPVALKLLRKRGRDDEVRFLREARAAARLENEHVARVLDVGRIDDRIPFIVMEYLEGMDLAQRLKARGPLAIDEASELLLEACEAVAEAHSMGIIHRDIKPSNLFLASRRDGSKMIKVLDFGISKLTRKLDDASGDLASMTGTASVVGSACYMSPEQLRDSKHVDARTDIWSIGVVLHELLTGESPFGGDSAAAVGARIASAPPKPLRAFRPEAPEALERVILRCLEKDPVARYGDVAALGRALLPFAPATARQSLQRMEALLHHEGVASSETTQPADELRPDRSATVYRPGTIVLGVVAVGVVLAVVWSVADRSGSETSLPVKEVAGSNAPQLSSHDVGAVDSAVVPLASSDPEVGDAGAAPDVSTKSTTRPHPRIRPPITAKPVASSKPTPPAPSEPKTSTTDDLDLRDPALRGR